MKRLLRIVAVLCVLTTILLGGTILVSSRNASERACYTVTGTRGDTTSEIIIGSLDGRATYSIEGESIRAFFDNLHTWDLNPEIFYSQNYSGSLSSWLYIRNGTNVYRLRNHPVFDSHYGMWSSDVRWLIYAWHDTPDSTTVSIIDHENKNGHDYHLGVRLEQGGGIRAFEPIWSADNQFVMFEGYGYFYVIEASSGNLYKFPVPFQMSFHTFQWASSGHHYLFTWEDKDQRFSEWGEAGNPAIARYRWPASFREIILIFPDDQIAITRTASGTMPETIQYHLVDLKQNIAFLIEEGAATSLTAITPLNWSSESKTLSYVATREVNKLMEFDLNSQQSRFVLSPIQTWFDENVSISYGTNTDDQFTWYVAYKGKNPRKYQFPLSPPVARMNLYRPLAPLTLFSQASYEIPDIPPIPIFWSGQDQNLIFIGTDLKSTAVYIFSPAGTAQTWTKPYPPAGQAIERLGDWLAIPLAGAGGVWLYNTVTAQEIALEAGLITIDKGAFVFTPTEKDRLTRFRIINEKAEVIAAYEGAALQYEFTPLRSPDNKHALLVSTDFAGASNNSRYRLSLYNGDTKREKELWIQDNVGSLEEMSPLARWLPDSSGLIALRKQAAGVQVIRLDNRGETLWTRTLPEWVNYWETEIIDCRLIEQLDMQYSQRLLTFTLDGE